ncbi:LysM peptidoglycan-binding domain-containing protein [Serinicoccus marinus]|uniref:LysM peptidoglycan-binding domain-containing protein n=1 Tax=Serinicoccus marinus TaxID=247333 RepID=UPI0003B31945|nr:LysM domain-containing protein [Serinicoccus marinus]
MDPSGSDLRTRGAGPAGCGLVGTVGATVAGTGLLGRAVTTWPGGGPGPLGPALLSAMLLLAAGLLLATGAVLAAATWHLRPGTTGATRRTTPSAPVRLASALLISISASAAAATGAAALAAPPQTPVVLQPGVTEDTPSDAEQPSGTPSSAPVPTPGWTPTSGPTQPAHADVALVSGRVADDLPDRHVVRRGDTLWDLAQRHLGADATAVQVAQEWPRWYAANRGVIGPDPDLLLPGQELVVPGTTGPGR